MPEETTTVESDDDLLDRFEERYQTEQVLNSSSGVEANITHAGWRDGTNDEYIGAVCLYLSVPGGSEFPVVVPSLTQKRGEDFLSLLEWLGQSPQQDLSVLENERVDIDIVSESGKDFVRMDTGSGTLRGQVVDDPALVTNAPPELPERVVAGLARVRADRRADGATPVRVDGLSATEQTLVLGLEGDWGTVEVPVERAYEQTPQTPYEKLVEHVGEGSVKQIEGGSVYLVRERDVPGYLGTKFARRSGEQRRGAYDEYAGITADTAGRWALFVDEPPQHSATPALDLDIVVAALVLSMPFLFGILFGAQVLWVVGVFAILVAAWLYNL